MDFNTTGGSDTPPRSPSVAAGQGSGREFDTSDPARSFVNTVWRVLFSPKDFFRNMPPRGGFTNPLIFAVVCAFITALFSGVVNEIMLSIRAMQGMAADIPFYMVMGPTFLYLMFWLALVTVGNHLFVRLIVGRNNGGLQATFRVLSYTRVVQVVWAVPLLNLVAWIYGLYLCAFGFKEVHSTTYGKAAAIVALPMLLFILLVIVATGVLIALAG